MNTHASEFRVRVTDVIATTDRACAEHGKRYVDLAGELHFIKEMIVR